LLYLSRYPCPPLLNEEDDEDGNIAMLRRQFAVLQLKLNNMYERVAESEIG
jgi:hypothetical protein